jgi:hypothetical protein
MYGEMDWILVFPVVDTCSSVRTEGLGSTGLIFIKFDITLFYENMSRISKCQSFTRIKLTFHEDQYIFLSAIA